MLFGTGSLDGRVDRDLSPTLRLPGIVFRAVVGLAMQIGLGIGQKLPGVFERQCRVFLRARGNRRLYGLSRIAHFLDRRIARTSAEHQ